MAHPTGHLNELLKMRYVFQKTGNVKMVKHLNKAIEKYRNGIEAADLSLQNTERVLKESAEIMEEDGFLKDFKEKFNKLNNNCKMEGKNIALPKPCKTYFRSIEEWSVIAKRLQALKLFYEWWEPVIKEPLQRGNLLLRLQSTKTSIERVLHTIYDNVPVHLDINDEVRHNPTPIIEVPSENGCTGEFDAVLALSYHNEEDLGILLKEAGYRVKMPIEVSPYDFPATGVVDLKEFDEPDTVKEFKEMANYDNLSEKERIGLGALYALSGKNKDGKTGEICEVTPDEFRIKTENEMTLSKKIFWEDEPAEEGSCDLDTVKPFTLTLAEQELLSSIRDVQFKFDNLSDSWVSERSKFLNATRDCVDVLSKRICRRIWPDQFVKN